ncbi:MAG: hypothetical protein JJT78_01215 [Leptospira sp.]|nr:hypothetical protein [Leptospira sp.]
MLNSNNYHLPEIQGKIDFNESLNRRTFRIFKETENDLVIENQWGEQFPITKEILETNRIPYREESFVLDEFFFRERFHSFFQDSLEETLVRLECVLKDNPKKIFEADWILEVDSPFWFVTFPSLRSGLSVAGSFPTSLGILLELWKEFPDLQFTHRDTGSILYVIQMGRGISGTYHLTAYNKTENRIDSFRSPVSEAVGTFPGGRVFEILRGAQKRMRAPILYKGNLLNDFLNQVGSL